MRLQLKNQADLGEGADTYVKAQNGHKLAHNQMFVKNFDQFIIHKEKFVLCQQAWTFQELLSCSWRFVAVHEQMHFQTVSTQSKRVPNFKTMGGETWRAPCDLDVSACTGSSVCTTEPRGPAPVKLTACHFPRKPFLGAPCLSSCNSDSVNPVFTKLRCQVEETELERPYEFGISILLGKAYYYLTKWTSLFGL